MSVVFAADCIELQPANTIRSAAALGMANLFMVKSSNGNGERKRFARQGSLSDAPSQRAKPVCVCVLAQLGEESSWVSPNSLLATLHRINFCSASYTFTRSMYTLRNLVQT